MPLKLLAKSLNRLGSRYSGIKVLSPLTEEESYEKILKHSNVFMAMYWRPTEFMKQNFIQGNKFLGGLKLIFNCQKMEFNVSIDSKVHFTVWHDVNYMLKAAFLSTMRAQLASDAFYKQNACRRPPYKHNHCSCKTLVRWFYKWSLLVKVHWGSLKLS